MKKILLILAIVLLVPWFVFICVFMFIPAIACIVAESIKNINADVKLTAKEMFECIFKVVMILSGMEFLRNILTPSPLGKNRRIN